MAEVWEGHDEVLSRPVAVKVLHQHLAADATFLERFRREAVTAARLAHPGIVATFDTGLDHGTAFIVMELVRGRNLRQVLDDQGRLQPWQAVGVARQIADALSYAHSAGLVHRDIKPANVLLVEEEWGGLRVKVTDFGIAKAGVETGADLTRTGMVLGTPKYLSPEQIQGQDPDARADLYSVGVVLYEMLAGAPPYVGDTDMATALAHLSDKIPKLSAAVRGVPSGLDKIVVDLLAKAPDRRVQSAADLRARLDALGPLAPPSDRSDAPGAGWRSTRRRSPVDSAVPAEEAVLTGAGNPSARVDDTAVDNSSSSPTAVFHGGFSAPPPPPPGAGWHAGPSGYVPAGTADTGPVPKESTDEWESPPHGGVRDGGHRRTERNVGLVVLSLVVIGAVIAGVIMATGSKGGSTPPVPKPGSTSEGAVHISGVTVFMVNGRPPDNPNSTPLAFDGNPGTFWQTDVYSNSTFGNLYPGIGLAIDLGSDRAVHSLTVTSPTTGWAASTYVSGSEIPSGQPVTSWGSPTDRKSGIRGDASFSLAGRRGRYVLLWITNLGPADTAKVAELAIS